MELTFTEADPALWEEYDALARRAYGQAVPDIARLGRHADRRVALRGGRVVAGGLGLLIPQWFGGRPVPSASMACGCVAPEERGGRLAARLADERLRALREQGAVLATLWTASNGYVRRMGWEAPAQVFSWTVPTDALKESRADTMEITFGDSDGLAKLREELAGRWNGPWQRPGWWSGWQQDQHPDLSTYAFAAPGGPTSGVLAVAVKRHPDDGRQLVVHDFWVADHPTAAAMLSFLGRHHSRIPTVAFERTGLPPGTLLLHRLGKGSAAAARAWHPWMLRVLDPCRAVELRGWPEDVDAEIVLDLVAADGSGADRYTLRIGGGQGELRPGGGTVDVTLTAGQFAVWYAGGYRGAAAAALAGLRGEPATIARLLAATGDREPWLADYF
ncbi:enhanced intracellular survival protein Eis [Streptomyces sp. NPDC002476]|uniref:GNAT family N-acetyltransferase n=1 Tax=Streptomyces sp. NPDC002476 TaxID=3364648 RepID=UPI0036837F7F